MATARTAWTIRIRRSPTSSPGWASRACRSTPSSATPSRAARSIGRGAPSLVMGVQHGPPGQSGMAPLDVPEDRNDVGDPDLAIAIAEAKINFGVFGHILESGGRAKDLEGKKPVKRGQPASALYLNP